MATTNLARFKIGTSPSTDRGYDATNAATVAFQLEASPALDVLQAVFSVHDPAAGDAPFASEDAPDLVWDNSLARYPLAHPTDVAHLTFPASGVHSYLVRCEAVTASGVQKFERLVVIRSPQALRKTVPFESTQYDANGWSPSINEIVDALAGLPGGGGDYKGSVLTRTTAPLAAYTFAANVLTASGNGAFPNQDGLAVPIGGRVLVMFEAGGNQKYNGLYTLTQAGSGGTPWKLTRAIDADSSAEVTGGMLVPLEPTASLPNGGIFQLAVDDPITLNTTGLVFVLVASGAGLDNDTWLAQAAWQVSFATGSDSASGLPGSPLKTLAEFHRRVTRQRRPLPQETAVTILDDVPLESNLLPLDQLIVEGSKPLRIKGTRTVVATGTITGWAGHSANTSLPVLTDATADFSTFAGLRVRFTSGAATGASAQIQSGAAVTDATLGVITLANTTAPYSPGSGPSYTEPSIGDTYEVYDCTDLGVTGGAALGTEDGSDTARVIVEDCALGGEEVSGLQGVAFVACQWNVPLIHRSSIWMVGCGGSTSVAVLASIVTMTAPALLGFIGAGVGSLLTVTAAASLGVVGLGGAMVVNDAFCALGAGFTFAGGTLAASGVYGFVSGGYGWPMGGGAGQVVSSGNNTITGDLGDIGFAAYGSQAAIVRSYATGTNYVHWDGSAYLDAGTTTQFRGALADEHFDLDNADTEKLPPIPTDTGSVRTGASQEGLTAIAVSGRTGDVVPRLLSVIRPRATDSGVVDDHPAVQYPAIAFAGGAGVATIGTLLLSETQYGSVYAEATVIGADGSVSSWILRATVKIAAGVAVIVGQTALAADVQIGALVFDTSGAEVRLRYTPDGAIATTVNLDEMYGHFHMVPS